ncbi:hypothetical protein MNAB215_4154 [Mycobacterium numidiamassiliense]|uniref:Uncharacterized protein n=1 Tax=Mycobacterium numidiamassiliense TaxID=1841861 RepID=A0A2U3PDV4_9MYCO|nr:hypothetical protein [Mycobacterium numidiamassiliense]SPM41937.1 hypothetical protein MNAB215_4154 [Mycobacterium numidiamassiliense]
MAELVDLYSKGIKRELKNYWAAWLPSTRWSVGDVGTLNGYVFEKVGTLTELGMKYYAESDDNASPLDISSGSNVALSFKSSGETNAAFSYVAEADAGLKIDFGSKGAFVIQAPETFESALADRPNLQFQIRRAYAERRWEKDWLVVTRLIKAPSATVLISKSVDASLELSAKANLSGVVAALGSAKAGLAVKYQKGDTISIIGGQNITPLFQLSRLKTAIFDEPKLLIKSARASDPSIFRLNPDLARDDDTVRDSLVFETLSDDELLEK